MARSTTLKSALLACAFGAAVMMPAVALAADAVPALEVPGYGWSMVPTPSTDFEPVPGAKVRPMTNDPKFPHVGNREPGQKTDRVADITNPILKPWAADAIKKTNDRVTKDGRVPFVATSRCWPSGVPGQLLVPTAIQFIQRQNEVYLVYIRDHFTRRIWMNVPHDPKFEPTWFGESTGKYVNGDLVVDTVKILDHPYSFVDNFRTPHTKDLHVVETYHIGTNAKGGKNITVTAHVEDPGAFNMPWDGIIHYDYGAQNGAESPTCAENNPDYYGLEDYPLPTAVKLDF